MKNNPALLRIPGPTPIPENIQRALSQPMINHRGPVMNELFDTLKNEMKHIFGTKGQILFLSGSGTSAMETAVTNIISAKDQVLVLVSGNFGERFAEICEAKHLIVHKIIVPMGKAVDPTDVGYYLEKNPQIKAVFATLCETSTGVLNPIKAISSTIKEKSDALFVVDGVSAVGAVDVQMDNWGIDVVVTSSQKALMLPPGLAIIAMRDDTWQKVQNNKGSQFYFDLIKYKESLNENRMPFTPPISLLYGLHESITMIKNEGSEQVYKRHQLLKQMIRGAMKELDYELLVVKDHDASPTVTTIVTEHLDTEKLMQFLREQFGLIIAGGLGFLKGKIIRIGHMGYCSPAEMLQIISLLELGFKQFDSQIELGRGISKAQEIYCHHLMIE